MNSKNKYSLICINVVLILNLLLNSCAKEIPKLPKKRDRTTINKYLELGYKSNDNSNFDSSYYYFNKAKHISFYSGGTNEMTAKLVGSAGLRMSMTDVSFFTLQADYTSQGSYKEVMAGALYSWKLDDSENPKYTFHAGAYLRWKDALIPVAKVEFRPLAIAISYDANISQLKTGSNGRGGF